MALHQCDQKFAFLTTNFSNKHKKFNYSQIWNILKNLTLIPTYQRIWGYNGVRSPQRTHTQVYNSNSTWFNAKWIDYMGESDNFILGN